MTQTAGFHETLTGTPHTDGDTMTVFAQKLQAGTRIG